MKNSKPIFGDYEIIPIVSLLTLGLLLVLGFLFYKKKSHNFLSKKEEKVLIIYFAAKLEKKYHGKNYKSYHENDKNQKGKSFRDIKEFLYQLRN